MDLQIVYFIMLGLVGGFTAVLLAAKSWNDLKTFSSVKRYVLGAIVGGLYFMLYSEHNFPNFIMAFVSGYFGTDFIDKLIGKVRKPKEKED